MSEIEDQVSLFGAVDEALLLYADEPAALEEVLQSVSALLGPYRDGAALGWFRGFEAWTNETQPEADPLPTVDEALDDMSRGAPEGRSRSRRLLAIAALARAQPDTYGPDGEESARTVAALQPLTSDGDGGQADALLRLLSGQELGGFQFRELAQWGEMLAIAHANGLVDGTTAAQIEPPCSGRVIGSGRPGEPPAAKIETHFCTGTVDISQLKRYLSPGNWPTCSPQLWCGMDRRNPGQSPARYIETISIDCTSASAWKLITCLKFITRDLVGDGSAIAVEYRLCDDQSLGDGHVKVDEGSIVARQQGNQLCITTTKRVRFDWPFTTEMIAMLVCALGWAAAAEDMVYKCVPEDADSVDPWPEGEPGMEPRMAKKVTGPGDEPNDVDPAGVLDDFVDVTTKCLKECAAAYRSYYEKALDGSYTANDYVQSMAEMWTRAARDLSRLATVGTRLRSQGPVARHRSRSTSAPDDGVTLAAPGAEGGGLSSRAEPAAVLVSSSPPSTPELAHLPRTAKPAPREGAAAAGTAKAATAGAKRSGAKKAAGTKKKKKKATPRAAGRQTGNT